MKKKYTEFGTCLICCKKPCQCKISMKEKEREKIGKKINKEFGGALRALGGEPQKENWREELADLSRALSDTK